ncbi:MAG: SDR family oxidoreductase [Actinomycetota bacterium]|nr:SDR family oxidoreductase [Actinomycetota bacterium]
MKPLSDQVVVVTGASSGIGRESALLLAERGARVVLASRNREALETLADEIRAGGGECAVAPADVTSWRQMQDLAAQAVSAFGRIDTWVNGAAVSLYARVEDAEVDEIERVIQVGLLGYVYGMKAALPHLVASGGTIINISSIAAVRPIPLQAPYSASKAAVKAFGDALRLELEHDERGVAVTTILPASINTPFFAHARSKLGAMAGPFPPVYEPRTVAEAIAFCAEHPRRDVFVGGAAKLIALQQKLMPALTDWLLLRAKVFERQQTDRSPDGDIFFEASSGPGSSAGDFRPAIPVSPYTRYIELSRLRGTLPLLAGAAGAAFAVVRRLRGSPDSDIGEGRDQPGADRTG